MFCALVPNDVAIKATIAIVFFIINCFSSFPVTKVQHLNEVRLIKNSLITFSFSKKRGYLLVIRFFCLVYETLVCSNYRLAKVARKKNARNRGRFMLS